MRQWLIFKIGYVCQIPQEGGGRAYLANSLSGFHGNRKPPLTNNGENDDATFSRLFLIQSILH